MYLRIIIIIIGYFIFANLFSSFVIKASNESNIVNIVTTNFSKSVTYFYSNTVKDIGEYINNKFAFYSTMVKNLNSQNNFNRIYNLVYNQIEVLIIDTVNKYKPSTELNNYK